MTREPRTSFQYNNIMYIVASHVIEVVTGHSLDDVFKERIWEPLGMRDTYLSLQEAREYPLPLARGYHWDADEQEQVETEWMDTPWGSGAGCVISNVLDYAKWLRAMIEAAGPMSKAGHERLTKPIMPFDSGLPANMPDRFYALGWRMTWYHGEKVVWHTGGVRGFGAIALFLPGKKWECVMLGNAEDTSNNAHERLVWYLVDELLGVPEGQRFDWDVKNEEKVQRKEEGFRDARARLYPDAVDLPHALKLEAYTGVYMHPAYHAVELVLQDGHLHADAFERTWPHTLDFEHVSGEHFVVYGRCPGQDEKSAAKAVFEVGADGKPETLEVEFREDVAATAIVYVRQGAGARE